MLQQHLIVFYLSLNNSTNVVIVKLDNNANIVIVKLKVLLANAESTNMKKLDKN